VRPLDIDEEEQPYRDLIRYGSILLLIAAVVDVAAELRRALSAMDAWICRTTPTPSGPDVCEHAFLIRWMAAHFPLYVVAVGAVALLLNAVATAVRVRRAQLPGGFAWNRLLRSVAVIVCLIAVAELVACAGDATCGLSVSCS
jgi:hypothetical protein